MPQTHRNMSTDMDNYVAMHAHVHVHAGNANWHAKGPQNAAGPWPQRRTGGCCHHCTTMACAAPHDKKSSCPKRVSVTTASKAETHMASITRPANRLRRGTHPGKKRHVNVLLCWSLGNVFDFSGPYLDGNAQLQALP